MIQENKFFLDIYCQQNNHVGEFICGDVFLTKKVKEEDRTIVVLSDGMGSGVKANVLATLTASMAVNFAVEHGEITTTAEVIMDTLPVCSIRKMSYSTFTIIDIEENGFTTIVEYDNPECLILRGQKLYHPNWENIVLEKGANKGKTIRTCNFQAQLEDRIFFWSDGIVQSGMGSRRFPFGWGRNDLQNYVLETIAKEPYEASIKLAKKIVNKAIANDGGKSKDDSSAGIIYYRKPRRLLFVSGPPFNKEDDYEFSKKIIDYKGKKIIAGGTTAEVVVREMKLKAKAGLESIDKSLPPISYVAGIDLVTEGILTLGKVIKILEEYNSEYRLKNGPADRIVKMFLNSDEIHILNGTNVNVAHQDPNLPVELEIRRTVIKRIAKLLEEKFLKVVDVEYM
ncbi:MAG: serine/threonine-protein phosphatase [Bacteroidales bacterium]|nr:serine/threonine-protein phosphatase [Bacteroidales bacterium]